jgi:hypothetical protein
LRTAFVAKIDIGAMQWIAPTPMIAIANRCSNGEWHLAHAGEGEYLTRAE